jgi:hypothetical protein
LPHSNGSDLERLPKLPPPRWKAARGSRGCLGNLLLIGVGLFGIIAASCLLSGGLVDWAIRQTLSKSNAEAPLLVEPLPSPLEVRRGLGPGSSTVKPAGNDDVVEPDRPPPEKKEQPRRTRTREDAMFGVQ